MGFFTKIWFWFKYGGLFYEFFLPKFDFDLNMEDFHGVLLSKFDFDLNMESKVPRWIEVGGKQHKTRKTDLPLL